MRDALLDWYLSAIGDRLESHELDGEMLEADSELILKAARHGFYHGTLCDHDVLAQIIDHDLDALTQSVAGAYKEVAVEPSDQACKWAAESDAIRRDKGAH